MRVSTDNFFVENEIVSAMIYYEVEVELYIWGWLGKFSIILIFNSIIILIPLEIQSSE